MSALWRVGFAIETLVFQLCESCRKMHMGYAGLFFFFFFKLENRVVVWKKELVMANLISVHCKQRSRDIWDHLQNYFLFIQLCNRSKFFCIMSFIWQLEECRRCVSMKQKGGKREHSIGIPLKVMLSALFVRFWQGFSLWKPFREDRSRWQGDPVCVIFGHSHWKSQIVVPFPPSPTHACFFFLPSFLLSLRTFLFF